MKELAIWALVPTELTCAFFPRDLAGNSNTVINNGSHIVSPRMCMGCVLC